VYELRDCIDNCEVSGDGNYVLCDCPGCNAMPICNIYHPYATSERCSFDTVSGKVSCLFRRNPEDVSAGPMGC